jgi:hypothetical protein
MNWTHLTYLIKLDTHKIPSCYPICTLASKSNFLKKLAAQQTIYFTNNELKIGKLPEFQLLFVKLDPY